MPMLKRNYQPGVLAGTIARIQLLIVVSLTAVALTQTAASQDLPKASNAPTSNLRFPREKICDAERLAERCRNAAGFRLSTV